MTYTPLAEQLRPASLETMVGQEHLLAEGKPLRRLLEQGQPTSMILWGPPGVGKTTLAKILAHGWDAQVISLSAVLAGVKEIREAIQTAQQYRERDLQTVLFVDEIHRFNKSQQDAFLPHIESGLLVMIGATTENPAFELNNALLSRMQVFVLKGLHEDALAQLLARACQRLKLNVSPEAAKMIQTLADGDGRRLLNLLEPLPTLIDSKEDAIIDVARLQSMLGVTQRRFDKGGDYFYDQISALHKSVRGSDPDAALYWFSRMIDGGIDPLYLVRRIVRMAWEDVGLADPRAMELCNAAAQTYERLGSPEGELALAQAVIYLAVAPKSNAGYVAYKKAVQFVVNDRSREVPIHLRNAPTKLAKSMGHGQQYRYAHDEPEGYAAGEHYWPDGMNAQSWYQPVERGLEIKIKNKLLHLKSLDREKMTTTINDKESE